MTLVRSGGYRWAAALAGWGKQGVSNSKSLTGYLPKGDGAGRLADAAREKQTVNVWSAEAVYALYSGDRLVYVGEGLLGDRLWKHYRDVRKDLLVGRWDTFTWISPWEYGLPDKGGNATFKSVAPGAPASAKKLIEVLELVLVRLASPPGNSQLPSADKEISWLLQTRAPHAEGTIADNLRVLMDTQVTKTPAKTKPAKKTKTK